MLKMYPLVLTIAGSDSSGGAGIQADLKTFMAFGAYGSSVITAVTAQNTQGVSAVNPVPVEWIKGQLQAVLSDLSPRFIKTGLFPTKKCALAVAEVLRNYQEQVDFRLVVDPVNVSTSGDILTEPGVLEVLKKEILPLAFLVTPNLAELRALTEEYGQGTDALEDDLIHNKDKLDNNIEGSFSNKHLSFNIENILSKEQLPYNIAERKTSQEVHSDDINKQIEKGLKAGRFLLKTGVSAVLVKGGHAGGKYSNDYLLRDSEIKKYTCERIVTAHGHGTGCTLSAAITAGLARGWEIEKAIEKAKEYLTLALKKAVVLGRGIAPLNHLAGVDSLWIEEKA